MSDKKETVIALLGQPNSGKSTLFNALTGLRQHVGNWPGKTVEQKEGTFSHNGKNYIVADLPGTYSLSANSEEEMITRDYISSGKADVVCILADSSQLERSLYMLSDFAGITVPCFLLLNMCDVAEEQGKKVDASLLEKRLGIPVVPFSAPNRKTYDSFFKALERTVNDRTVLDYSSLKEKYSSIANFEKIRSYISEEMVSNYSSVWLAAKAVEGDGPVITKIKSHLSEEKLSLFENEISAIEKGVLQTGKKKFEWIDTILDGAVISEKKSAKFTKFDKAITHRIWGKPLVVLITLAGLIASFIPALPFMGVGSAIGGLVAPAGKFLTGINCPSFITSLVCDVCIRSLGFVFSMLGFVFGVTLVFGLLEETGVMARISYVFDNSMSKLGLQGKSVMPFLISFGCTMGGAAGTRVIDNWGQKVLTIALAWAIPCGAAWAIIPMLSTLFFGPGAVLIIVVILAVMIVHMWFTSKVFGRFLVKTEERMGMIMELPPYHKAKWGSLLRYVFGRTKETFVRAIKVVFLVGVTFWLLSFSSSGLMENSILYKVGTFIEPVTKLFGMSWKTFMAFIASSLGKEGALGVLSTIYTGNSMVTIGAVMGEGTAANINELLLTYVTKPEALALIFALTFNMPCIVALATTYQETHSAKWTALIAIYYTVIALLLSCIAFHIGTLIW